MKTWERRIAEAKGKHRPKLRDWARDQFASPGSDNHERFQCLQALGQQQQQGQIPRGEISRVDSSTISVEDFIVRFEEPSIPVVVCNNPQQGARPDSPLYSFTRLRKNYGSRIFKVGEDDEGYKVKVKLKYFLQYLRSNSSDDDSPLYVFDSTFDDDEVAKSILDAYSVPHLFPDDLFSLVGEKRRPPYRWFLVGGKRSGTCVHIDPLGTSAWNTIIRGRKRWVLFPPETPKRIAKALDVIQKGEDDEAVHYFTLFLPRLRQLQQQQKNFTMIEFTQYPGETVFVPGGWWHAVLNLDDTVAVTQNFCSRTNFINVWKQTREGRKKMAASWLKRLRIHYPLLAQAADRANSEDGFIVYSTKNKCGSSGTICQEEATAVEQGGTDAAGHRDTNAKLSHKHLSKSKVDKMEKKRSLDSSRESSGGGNTTSESDTSGTGKKGRW